MTADQEFWKAHYGDVFQQGQPWLDYSNDRVQAQTFGLTLEAAGSLPGKRCVDVGCGWGQLARAFHDFGAAEVTAIDIVVEAIDQLSVQFPHIRWLAGDISTDTLDLPRASADILLLVEVLQYMPMTRTLEIAWDLIAPGGRLIAMVPNADCPIVTATRERFDSRYAPPTVEQVRSELSALDGVEVWACRGLLFVEDQRIAPYEVTPWTQVGDWPKPPNRLQFVVIKGK